jgi:nucleotide-binding universal stress UspA family protein
MFITLLGDILFKRLEIRKILVPYDSSECSENALDYAVYLSSALSKSNPEKQSVRIIILHIIQDLPLTKAILDKMISINESEKPSLDRCITSIYEEIRHLMKEDIDKKKQKYKNIDGIKIESDIIQGDPSNKIIEYVIDNMIDMIVMGSKGLHGLAKIKGLGSVSRKVSESVQCPIVIIR